MTSKPTAKTAINILRSLEQQVGPANLAYWVTPNTVLTLSGARAYCDGVFYHASKKQLKSWESELTDSIKTLESITDVYFGEAKIDELANKECYAGYDVVVAQGLEYTLEQTALLTKHKQDLLNKNLKNEELLGAICSLLKEQKGFRGFNQESLNHIAFGILVGYPDSAIMSSINEWEKDDHLFAEPLIEADIRGSWYYFCPQPIYLYPRHMVTDQEINTHERLWSSILKDFYTSDFHSKLSKDAGFQVKAKELGLYR